MGAGGIETASVSMRGGRGAVLRRGPPAAWVVARSLAGSVHTTTRGGLSWHRGGAEVRMGRCGVGGAMKTRLESRGNSAARKPLPRRRVVVAPGAGGTRRGGWALWGRGANLTPEACESVWAGRQGSPPRYVLRAGVAGMKAPRVGAGCGGNRDDSLRVSRSVRRSPRGR